MKTNPKEKKQKDRISQEELLKAVAALEEIVMAEMPKEWEEEEVAEVKDKIKRKLLANGKELARSSLYRTVRGDRMGLSAFNRALQSLKASGEIAIVKKDTGGRPVEKINLLRREL